jgi:hypothetical protein
MAVTYGGVNPGICGRNWMAKVYSVPRPLHGRHSMSHEKQRGQNWRG